MDGSIASAVMLPEQDGDSPQPPASSPAGNKRRQSSTSEQDPKRQRLNSIDAKQSSIGQDSSKSSDSPSTGRRERGRERRLFGAALGALSHNSSSALQKRRSEIERRQKARQRVDEQESDQRKLEHMKRLGAQRAKEQAAFEEKSIRIRHANLLHMAHFLRTDAEPPLYYKPWETTPDQDRRIRQQITEAEETIRREQEAMEAAEEERGARISCNGDHAERDADADAPPGKELHATLPQDRTHYTNSSNLEGGPDPKYPEQNGDHAEDFANEAMSGGERASERQDDASMDQDAMDESSKDLMDENGEEVVEAAEDTVIY